MMTLPHGTGAKWGKKVYCKNCRHFLISYSCHYQECKHPACFKDSPTHPQGTRVTDYEELNRKNDCKYCEVKPPNVWRRMWKSLGATYT